MLLIISFDIICSRELIITAYYKCSLHIINKMNQLQQIESSVSIYSFESDQKTNHLLTDICFQSTKTENFDEQVYNLNMEMNMEMKQKGCWNQENITQKRDRWVETEKFRGINFDDLKPPLRFLTVNDSSSNKSFESLIYNGEKKEKSKKQFMKKLLVENYDKANRQIKKQLLITKKKVQPTKCSQKSKMKSKMNGQKQKRESKKKKKLISESYNTEKNQKQKLEKENQFLWGLLRHQKYNKFVQLSKKKRRKNGKQEKSKKQQIIKPLVEKECQRTSNFSIRQNGKSYFENQQQKICNSSLKYLKNMQITLRRVQKKLDKVILSNLTKKTFRQHKSLPR